MTNYDKTKNELKQRLPEYLEQLGLSIDQPFTCLNPNHEDPHPSMSLNPRDKQHVHCFGCGAHWDIFDLIALKELHKPVTDMAGQPNVEYSLPEAYNAALKLFDVKGEPLASSVSDDPKTAKNEQQNELNSRITKVNQQMIANSQDRLTDTDYFEQRGISLETAQAHGLGYLPNWVSPKAALTGKNVVPSPRLIIPNGPASYLARDTRNDLSDTQQQYAKMKEGPVNLFNGKAVLKTQPVFIVEGELDALSVIETGLADAVALGSVSNTQKLADVLDKAGISGRHRPSNPTFYIAMDNDNAGITAIKRVEMLLDKRHLKHYTVTIGRGYKDANEALTADRGKFVSEIERVLKDPNDYLQGLLDYIRAGQDTKALPTGFKNLDDVLDGGLYEGLYGVGAISSLGKTTFVLQIADNLAMTGQPVMYFALEMGRYELMTKSISRHTLTNAITTGHDTNLAQTTRSILKGHWDERYNQDQLKNVMTAFEQYGDYYANVMFHDGAEQRYSADDVAREVDDYVARTGKRPVVIVDYLQLLKAADERATDKANVTTSVNILKKIATKHHVPVIVISSFNRAKYNETASMEAFKESGDIEYSTDVLLALQFKGVGADNFDVNQAKAQEVRNVEAVVLKNRNGATGDTLDYGYYPMFNYFADVDSVEADTSIDTAPLNTQVDPVTFEVTHGNDDKGAVNG